MRVRLRRLLHPHRKVIATLCSVSQEWVWFTTKGKFCPLSILPFPLSHLFPHNDTARRPLLDASIRILDFPDSRVKNKFLFKLSSLWQFVRAAQN